jgi:glyoxylase-like metal-dependent hydrolase (beta-lactamase superfamily II)
MVRAMAKVIDVMHLGRDRVIGAWELDGVVIDPGPASTVETLLAEVEPRALLLTHIHLDHAGASGVLVRRFPNLKVYVHERGAPHLIDPRKLLQSASQLYGDEMDRLWGEVAPVPEENLVVLSGGETVEGLRVEYTPGHASHHVSYLDEDTGEAFVGDVGGVRVPPSDFTVAPTPPPDIDLERWRESLEIVAGWRPESLCLTHFGRVDDPEAQIAALRERLDRWGALAGEGDRERFIGSIEHEIRANADEETFERYRQAAPPDQLWLGLERYWRKRSERDQAKETAA